jgi:hypothetical protein
MYTMGAIVHANMFGRMFRLALVSMKDIATQFTLVNPALVNPDLDLTQSKTQGTNRSGRN